MATKTSEASANLGAREAAAALGVSVATLYAYVSRGLVRSESTGGSRRERRYRREDVERLIERKAQRREPERAAERALRWGTPVLESALTLIEGGQLYYRGRRALGLAETHTFEAVAELLWEEEGGRLETAPAEARSLPSQALSAWESSADDWSGWRGVLKAVGTLSAAGEAGPAALFPIVLPLAAREDAAAHDLRPEAVRRAGRRIIRLLARAAVYPGRLEGDTLAEGLQRAWAPGRAGAAHALNAALVLCADHELNVSAFTARCAASAGATPYDAVIAGLAALRGTRHGGHTERVEALLDEVGTAGRAKRVLGERLRRGEDIPGFGHRLYPEGDPRGRRLLELAEKAARRAAAAKLARAVTTAAVELTGERPTVDFGLAALRRALGLPRGAALALFALGRTAGWIAHALEQYQSGVMIRPRARYVGYS